MVRRRRQTEAARRADERRQREDEARRLKDEVPQLATLRLEIEESSSDSGMNTVRHTRHIVVDHAPALFEIVCGDTSCRDGGHDLTWEIMRELRALSGEFEGEDVCAGQVGNGECGRVLHYVAHATYSAGPRGDD